MAPRPALGKKLLLELLAKRGPPISFGSPHDCVAVVEQDGVFRLRDLVVDPADSRALHDELIAKGHGFMPEHHYALGRPTGTIHLEAKTLAELMKLIEALSWPKHW